MESVFLFPMAGQFMNRIQKKLAEGAQRQNNL